MVCPIPRSVITHEAEVFYGYLDRERVTTSLTTDVKGCCPLDCQDTCAWVATVEDGRVIKVQGSREHPFTRGSLCAKVNDYQERTYSTDRLLHPLKRSGPKGEGKFERISWEEAITDIATRFSEIIEKYGPEALLPHNYMGSMGVVQRRALMRLFHELGASQFHGSICGAAGNVLDAEGHPNGFDPEEMVHSRMVILWGSNDLTTCHHHFHFMKEARRLNGARLICIDPRRTRTARACDEHIPIRPGTDTALANGMAHVMLREGVADLEFARQVTSDFDDYVEQVAEWTPERVASVCGIDIDVIEQLARDFGEKKPAVIRTGIAPQQSVNGEAFVRSVSALAILGGHWRFPGGGLFIEAYPVFYDHLAARPDLMTGQPRSLDMARLGQVLTDRSLEPPIMGLMIWGTNPAVVQPNAGLVRVGLGREDLFTVVLDHFLNDTARYADILLPSTTQLEHFDIQGAWGHHYISLNHPAISPIGQAKSNGEVMRLLAKRMGLEHPALQESDEQIAATALPKDVDLEALKANGWLKKSPARPDFEEGKLRLSHEIPNPVESTTDGHLQLLTPKSHYFLNSSFANMPRQRKAEKRPTLEMNPSDAAERGLSDGQQVTVKNEQGAITVWLRVAGSIRPGVVSLPGKWWSRPAETDAVANVLTPASWSPGGQPAYNEAFVEVVGAA